ncbi:hypothetical protein [Flavobacterium sp. 123]|jgi:hypothetical protein|uniref:CBU_0592 family membrane protein n=1 Tax=Flavobacterium sp. 123 TaxID=2135627 RepID=UPI000EB34A2B|nr:hypothetical protein [Flavobacterium sp. 123]RKT00734.1 hypothetical protein C8C88_2569 [Flavobacterium sp. 123]
MTLTDWIGFIGVTLLSIAYFLNLTNKLSKESLGYLSINFMGAGIACFASILLDYMPFIILEGSWTLVSAYGIIQYFKKK